MLAHELNFTRAAARLHITQQALSTQLRQLENRVGASLFDRTTRTVALTDAGDTLPSHVPGILAAVAAAMAETREVVPGERGSLIVGLAGVAGLDLTPRILRAFAAARPLVALTVRNIDFSDPSGGPLRGRRRRPAVASGARRHRGGGAARRATDGGAGRRPPAGRPGRAVGCRAGRAVSASPASVVRSLPWDDIVVRPVTGLEPATLAVCHRIGDSRPTVQAFVGSAVAQGHAQQV